MKLKFYVGAAIMSLFLMGCSESEDVSSDACTEQISTLTDILSNKITAYSNNPTTVNCNAMRSAGINLCDKAISCGFSEFADSRAQYVAMDCN